MSLSTPDNPRAASDVEAMVSRDVAAFGDRLGSVLYEGLDGGLVGAYFVGSVALGGYVPRESDVDVLAVCGSALDSQAKRSIAELVLETTSRCPARGLEFTLYSLDAVSSPPKGADFEVNANGGPRMPACVQLPEDQPAFWYILDRAVAHRFGVTIVGPPPAEVIADVPKTTLLAAMRESMRWHRLHEGATLYSVLNACRAWRFAEDGVLGSKLEGADWARRRWSIPEVIDAAVDLRHGRSARLDEREVADLLGHVESELSRVLSA